MQAIVDILENTEITTKTKISSDATAQTWTKHDNLSVPLSNLVKMQT